MTAEINVPQISQLNPQQPDYAAKLDEGIAQLRVASRALDELYRREASRFMGRDITDLLRASGVTVSDPRVLYEKEERNPSLLKIQREVSIDIVAGGIAEVRRIEDLVETYHETRDRKIGELRKKHKELRRAFEDYTDAALQLTCIQTLREVNPDYPTIHFFVVRRDGVYEAHIDLTRDKSIQFYKSENLTPELFDNDAYLEEFMRLSQGVNANAYLVKNPSSELSVDLLIKYAVLTVTDVLLKDSRRKTEERERKKTTGQRLVDRITSAMKFFEKKK